jgi:hypothetical protein
MVDRIRARGVFFLLAALFFLAGRANAYALPIEKTEVDQRLCKVETKISDFQTYLQQLQEGKKLGTTAAKQSDDRQLADLQRYLAGAVEDLHRSTILLRQQFEPSENWLETRGQMKTVLKDAHRVNQIMLRRACDKETNRFWQSVRSSINELSRWYGLSPMLAG